MTANESGGDPASPVTCTFTADELDVPPHCFDEDPADIGCSRAVWNEAESPRCVWHADQTDKPHEALAATVEDGTLVGARAPGIDFTEISFPENVSLVSADLSGANLQRADFSGANLQRADLSRADLAEADLSGANLRWADLSETDLTNTNSIECNLEGADLAYSSLGGANFSDAYLTEADLSGVGHTSSGAAPVPLFQVDRSHDRPFLTDFSGAYMESVDFTKAALPAADFSDAKLGNADCTNTHLSDSDFSNAGLSGTDFTNAEVDSADFSGTILSEALLSKADFTNTDFSEADLSDCIFDGATFRQANFRSAKLPAGPQLAGADLTETNLADQDLRDEDLSGAQLSKANLTDSDLSGADLSGANLERALLSRTDLFDTRFAGTRMDGTVFGDAQLNEVTFDQLAPLSSKSADRDLSGRLVRLIAGPTGHNAIRCIYDPKSQYGEADTEYTKSREDDQVDVNDGDKTDDPTVRASRVYRQFERLASENALPEWQQRFFILRQDMQTQQKTGRKYYFALLQRTVFGYGESFGRVIGWSSGIILLFALAYLLSGAIRPVESSGELGAPIVWTRLPEFPAVLWESFYYSTLTFTALGFGDFRPTNTFGQVLTVVETGTGAVLLALLVFVLGRQAAR